MFQRPSQRLSSAFKASREPVGINLVPMLDALVTLIAFLLFSMSFIAIVGLESLVPVVNDMPVEEQLQLKDKPVQITLTLGEREAEVWSPFDRFEAKVIPNLPDGSPDANAIHSALLSVKEIFPFERQIVFVPAPTTSYDQLVSAMDAARQLEAGDPPIYYKNPQTNVERAATELFPNIVFGNLLAEGG